MRWPLNKRIWKRINGLTARLAWKYANPGGPQKGIALRINDNHPLWKLNHWVGEHWINWYIQQVQNRHK